MLPRQSKNEEKYTSKDTESLLRVCFGGRMGTHVAKYVSALPTVAKVVGSNPTSEKKWSEIFCSFSH